MHLILRSQGFGYRASRHGVHDGWGIVLRDGLHYRAALMHSARSRAIGAMFFALFGAAWLALWNYRSGTGGLVFYLIIAALGMALFLVAHARYRRLDAAVAVAGEVETPEQRRRQRWFHIVNVGQWVLILVVANVLVNIGLAGWVLPAAVFVIGLHFLPLAKVFDYRTHYITGAALMLLALIVPRLAPGGPADPMICLGAGLVLWLAALWGLFASSR
jgi:hypothetical protein